MPIYIFKHLSQHTVYVHSDIMVYKWHAPAPVEEDLHLSRCVILNVLRTIPCFHPPLSSLPLVKEHLKKKAAMRLITFLKETEGNIRGSVWAE